MQYLITLWSLPEVASDNISGGSIVSQILPDKAITFVREVRDVCVKFGYYRSNPFLTYAKAHFGIDGKRTMNELQLTDILVVCVRSFVRSFVRHIFSKRCFDSRTTSRELQ